MHANHRRHLDGQRIKGPDATHQIPGKTRQDFAAQQFKANKATGKNQHARPAGPGPPGNRRRPGDKKRERQRQRRHRNRHKPPIARHIGKYGRGDPVKPAQEEPEAPGKAYPKSGGPACCPANHGKQPRNGKKQGRDDVQRRQGQHRQHA